MKKQIAKPAVKDDLSVKKLYLAKSKLTAELQQARNDLAKITQDGTDAADCLIQMAMGDRQPPQADARELQVRITQTAEAIRRIDEQIRTAQIDASERLIKAEAGEVAQIKKGIGQALSALRDSVIAGRELDTDLQRRGVCRLVMPDFPELQRMIPRGMEHHPDAPINSLIDRYKL